MELSKTEIDTLVALMDRIVPGDEFPSASAAGVLPYITHILDTDLRSFQDQFRSGLEWLDCDAEAIYKCPYTYLTISQQDDMIALLATGATACEWPVSSAEFIRMAINLVSELLCGPANGGNLDAVSWRMIGFEIAEGVRLPVEYTG